MITIFRKEIIIIRNNNKCNVKTKIKNTPGTIEYNERIIPKLVYRIPNTIRVTKIKEINEIIKNNLNSLSWCFNNLKNINNHLQHY